MDRESVAVRTALRWDVSPWRPPALSAGSSVCAEISILRNRLALCRAELRFAADDHRELVLALESVATDAALRRDVAHVGAGHDSFCRDVGDRPWPTASRPRPVELDELVRLMDSESAPSSMRRYSAPGSDRGHYDPTGMSYDPNGIPDPVADYEPHWAIVPPTDSPDRAVQRPSNNMYDTWASRSQRRGAPRPGALMVPTTLAAHRGPVSPGWLEVRQAAESQAAQRQAQACLHTCPHTCPYTSIYVRAHRDVRRRR